jgi:hypothetical protein
VLEARVGRLQTTWEEQLAAAEGVRARRLEAARQAATIRAAGRTSPTADQSWLEDQWEKTRRWASEHVDELKGLVAEHAATFRSVAKVLRVVGVALVAVGAVLAARPQTPRLHHGRRPPTDLDVPRTGPPPASAASRLPLDRTLSSGSPRRLALGETSPED